ncbi:hypothetical protein CGCA056_v008827 [Colletotrichum aenigma]|uniref:uncharacterized protein n=1 Tax=Colletotrichum aenigma TaxID=1215731 RepID=UPI00187272CC|nr:uncharacterized protein CGCA056_v008827 [Colletotrichum aenigma]KAF5520719.1 hypothetical protein CGCA056_v008827 [Colletotrichum aenigma]
MTAEINRRVNEAVNASIRPLQDQMTQLLTALNGLMSTDRATPTLLTSSIPTPSTADTTIQAISDGTAGYEVRAISLADIQKALTRKTEKADLKALLPPAVLAEFQELFQPDEAANLPPHRPGVDHTIPIKQESDGNEAALPWGPLYSMS